MAFVICLGIAQTNYAADKKSGNWWDEEMTKEEEQEGKAAAAALPAHVCSDPRVITIQHTTGVKGADEVVVARIQSSEGVDSDENDDSKKTILQITGEAFANAFKTLKNCSIQ